VGKRRSEFKNAKRIKKGQVNGFVGVGTVERYDVKRNSADQKEWESSN